MTCTLEGCNKKELAKGLCSMHYARIRRHGDPNVNKAPTDRTCGIEGCENKHCAKGLCSMHYCRKLKEQDMHPETIADKNNKQDASKSK